MEGRELAEESLSAGDGGVYHDFSEWARIPARNLDRLVPWQAASSLRSPAPGRPPPGCSTPF